MRYLIISDIHANIAALNAVLDTAPSDLPVWFLGDAVGYYPDPGPVLERLTALGDRLQVWLQGNHDAAVLADRPERLDLNNVALATIKRTSAQLSSGERALLERSLIGPEPAPGEPAITLVHGGPDDPLNHYLHDAHNAARAARSCHTRLCLVGHTHIPLKLSSVTPQVAHTWRRQPLFSTANNTFRYDEAMVFLNPGSVGQPRDGVLMPDGRPHAAYAILDSAQSTFAIHRVAYDLGDLPDRIHTWLSGYLDEDLIEKHILRLSRSV